MMLAKVGSTSKTMNVALIREMDSRKRLLNWKSKQETACIEKRRQLTVSKLKYIFLIAIYYFPMTLLNISYI